MASFVNEAWDVSAAHYHRLTERAWRAATDTWTQPFMVTYGSLVLHLIFYFAFCAIDFSYQFIPAMDKYKLQQGKYVPLSSQLRATLVVLRAKLIAWVPAILPYYGISATSIAHFNVSYETIPPWYKVLAVTMACLFVDDTWHYWYHRLSHNNNIYRYFHKVHHEYKAPFGVTTEYTHPMETIFFIPGFIGGYLFADHVIELYMFNLCKSWIGVVSHSGYDIWWLNPAYLMPGYLGVEPHDLHHEKSLDGNYAPTFTFWDKLCGTYVTRDMVEERRRRLGLDNGATPCRDKED